jgi:hypothetical protein
MARSEHVKKSIEVATARFVRKAAGRITKREAAKLGRLYGEDLHWKFLRTSGDKLASRETLEFSKRWGAAKYIDSIGIAFKRERRNVPRYEHTRGLVTTNHLAFLFWFYGPSSGRWPGESWTFTGTGYGVAA